MSARELHKSEPILSFLALTSADTPSFCQPAERALHDPTMVWMFFIGRFVMLIGTGDVIGQ